MISLTHLPERSTRPRNTGLTMVMDKGLSIRQAEDMIEVSSEYIDLVKLGFGTSYFTPKLKEKIALYKQNGFKVFVGGTFFEACLIRGQIDEYLRMLEDLGLEFAEVSDGSMELDHDEKLEYIRKVAKEVTVISEVGSKDNEHIIPPYQWLKMMKNELQAGSWKVIAEARESGTTGIYMGSGSVRRGLIDEILTEVSEEDIIWEAPQKSQQLFFIEKCGANVNLGNIGPFEVIPLETLRSGLRGDTFHMHLPK